MRVLIIGLDTPVGQALAGLFARRGREFVGLKRSECRWKRERQAKKALRRSACDIAVDLRIQAAADGAARIHELDVLRCAWLARAAQRSDILLLHASCARVFKGDTRESHAEGATPDGESTLARLLIDAENQVRQHCGKHLVLRMGPVFAASGQNVATRLLGQLDEGAALRLDCDRLGCPVAAEDAAWVFNAVADQLGCGVEAWGDFHYCSAERTSCYEFAEALLACASQYREFAERRLRRNPAGSPRNQELDCRRILNTFAVKRQRWRARLAEHVRKYYS